MHAKNHKSDDGFFTTDGMQKETVHEFTQSTFAKILPQSACVLHDLQCFGFFLSRFPQYFLFTFRRRGAAPN